MILQLNMMKLVGNSVVRYYHFAKPTLSAITNAKDLQTIIQKRLVRNIQDVNAQTLQRYSFSNILQQQLLLSQQASKDIEERTVKFTIINPTTYQHQIVQAKINQDHNRLGIDGFKFDLPFTPLNQQLHHFSEKRGTPNFQELQQYSSDGNVLYIFNLPQNISEQDIQATLKTNQVRISFKYCILGLPAYAKIQFQSQEDVKNCLEKLPSKKLSFGDRVAVIKSQSDAEKLQLGYRRLVVEIEEDSKFEHSVLQFSKYGRVLHIDWPIEAYLNPTIEEVKQFYKDSTELIKINKIYKDGTVQSQFYPTANYWGQNEDVNTDNIIDHAERLKQSYEHRARFAKNINVYVGKEHQVSLSNRGYCVVTYSTYQECQNFYFSHSSDMKIELVGDRLDFEWDKQFKREVLRQIDNEYLEGKKKVHEENLERKSQFIDPVTQGFNHLNFHVRDPVRKNRYKRRRNKKPYRNQEFNLFKRILNKLSLTELTQKKKIKSNYLRGFKRRNPFPEWTSYLKGFKNLKEKVTSKTFDELAEVELFGRVLPKDEKVQRFIVENSTYKESTENKLVKQNNLIIGYRRLKFRNKFYKRVQERNNRLANRALGKTNSTGKKRKRPAEGEAAGQEGSVPAVNDGQNIGKKQFSTRKPTAYYRKRTAKEEANFQMRYHQFIRSAIYEYMGVFHDKVIEESAAYKPSIINPQSLTWPDGTSYFTEDQVLEALQFRRNFAKAQEEYEDYVYGSEYLKSSGANLTKLNSDFKDLQNHALQYLTDIGIVQNIRKVSGQNLTQKVNILNAQSSEFGEEYKLQEQNGQQNLIKIRKLQHLLPLNRVHHLQQFIAENGNDISEKQSAIFQKFYKQMKSDGIIPDEVSDAFGVKRGKTLNQLFAEVGAVFQINKKDLQMAERAKTYSKEQVNDDIENQIKLERYRLKYRKINSNYFAKDTSQIYARDRQGYYRVSRYRQI